MARGVHEVIFGGGAQDLVHVPPTRVASATVAIEDLTQPDDGADRFILASGAAALDSYDATITVAAGAGQADPRLMTHAGALAVAGRTYAIETADGRSELFEAEAVSATTLRSKGPLSGAYAIGSHVRGVRLVAVFPLASAADEDLFDGDPALRVVWRYTIAGQVWNVDELVRLVRGRPSSRSLGEVETALRSAWPEVIKAMSPHGNRLRDLVSRAAARLDARLRSRGINTESLLAGAAGFELLLQFCVLQIAEQGFHPSTRDPQMFVDEQAREFARLWEWIAVGASAHGAADVDRDSDTAPPGSSRVTRSPFTRG